MILGSDMLQKWFSGGCLSEGSFMMRSNSPRWGKDVYSRVGHEKDVRSYGPVHHWQQLQALSSPYTSSTTTTINTLPGADCAVYCRGNEGGGKKGFNNSAARVSVMNWLVKQQPPGFEPAPSPQRISSLNQLCYALSPMYIDMNDIHI